MRQALASKLKGASDAMIDVVMVDGCDRSGAAALMVEAKGGGALH